MNNVEKLVIVFLKHYLHVSLDYIFYLEIVFFILNSFIHL